MIDQVENLGKTHLLRAIQRQSGRGVGDGMNDEPPSPVARRSILDWAQGLQDRAYTARSIFLNLLAVLAVVLALPILVRELFLNRVVIAPLSMPANIAASGLTGDVAANRLWDAWSHLNAEVAVAKETRDVLPSSQRIQFQIPDSGLSFDSLIHHLRSFLGIDETTVSGEFVCPSEPCDLANAALRLRVVGHDLSVITLDPVGTTPLDLYWREAITEVLLRLDPVRGIMATSLGNEERAIAELRKLVRANHPDRQWALVFAGVLLGNSGDTGGALASLDEATLRDPSFALAHAERASLLLKAEDIEGARTAVSKALQLAPSDARNHMRLAQIEVKAKAFDKAFAAYEQAARLQPNWPQIPLGLGGAHYARGDLAAAKAAFRTAIEIDPDFLDARQLLALLASAEGDAAEALKQQRAVALLKPNDAQAQADLAAALDLSGDLKAAEDSYLRAISLSPDTALFHKQLGLLRQKQLRHTVALASLERAAEIDPRLEDIWFAIGDTQLALGKLAEARESYARYIREQPNGAYAAIAGTRLKEDDLQP
jgi:tetratricopeptide (TPR) repeat protein